VNWTDRAAADFETVLRYMEKKAAEAAGKLRLALLDTARLLAANPYIGPRCEDIGSGRIREVYCHPYRVFYRVYPKKRIVELLSIWHSSRQDPDFIG